MSKLNNTDLQDWQKIIQGVTPLKTTDVAPQPDPEPLHYPDAEPPEPEFKLTHDLHGMTLKKAHAYLLELFEAAQQHDVPELRVITGKSGDLKIYFPEWMTTHQFIPLVRKVRLEQSGGSYWVYIRPID